MNRDYGLFKIVGSFKPWHRDFYDFAKLFYIDAALTLYKSLPKLDPTTFDRFRTYRQLPLGSTLPDVVRLQLENDFYVNWFHHQN